MIKVIVVKKIVNCRLVIECINEEGKSKSVIEGKGYYNEINDLKIVYFTNDNNKYKYEYTENKVTIHFNDSCYNFKLNEKGEGQIKNGEFILKLTTFASKIEIDDNCLNVNYILHQGNIKLGDYKTSLFLQAA